MATSKEFGIVEIETAIKAYDDQTIRKLIACGFDVNTQNTDGDTALHIAINANADLAILKLLMDCGANPALRNRTGNCPLDSIKHSSVQTIENILKLEKICDFRGDGGNACLHTLMRFHNRVVASEMSQFWKPIMESYEQSIFDFNSQNKHGDTPLMIAARTILYPDVSQHVKFILSNVRNLDLFIKNNDGDTFLHIFFRSLSVNREIEITNQLMRGELLYCPKICLQKLLSMQNKIGDTPFLQFLQNLNEIINVEILKLFIETGIDLNVSNIRGETAIHRLVIRSEGEFAVEGEKVGENIKYLVSHGSSINAQDISGALPITFAHSPITIKSLIEMNADVNVSNNLGQTPLMLHMIYDKTDLEVFEIFLEAGADVNAVDNHKSSILHYLAWEGADIDVLHLFQRYGAKEDTDDMGQLPCHVAFYCRHEDAFDALCKCEENTHGDKVTNFLFKREVTDLKSFMTLDSEIIEQFKIFHSCLKSDILYLPDIGRVSFEDEATLIKTFVYDLVRNFCKEIASEESLLSMNIIESGSLGEKTKVGRPDEFDFVCIFSELSKICEIDMTKLSEDPGFSYLKIRTDFEKFEGIGLFNEYGYLNTYAVWNKCQTLLKEFLLKPTSFNNSNATYCTYQRTPNYDIVRPTCRFSILWSGPFYKNMEINIDLVLACQMKGWWPKETTLCHLPHNIQAEIKEEGCIVILQAKYDMYNDIKNHSRISALTAEKKYMNGLPNLPKDAYAICKILCDDRICPEIQDENNDSSYQTCRDVVTSYMLKTCMFHILLAYSNDELIKNALQADQYTEEQLHGFVLRIFRTLLDYTEKESLPSFLFPKQNVFTFMLMDDLAQDCDNDNDTEDMNQILCAFRKIFVKFILTLLGDTQDFKSVDTTCISDHWKKVELADQNMIDINDYWEKMEEIESKFVEKS